MTDYVKLTDEDRERIRSREYYLAVKEYVVKSQVVAELKKRSVWWFVETYLSPHEFEYALNKASHWAYAYHDKDNKEPHYHVLLHYDNSRSGNAVLRDFIGYQNTFVEKPKYSPIACYEYLTHLNDPDKYQYSSDIIVSHNPVYWEHFLPSVRDRTESDFIEDLLNTDSFDLVSMAKKYGRDFIKNYRNYIDFRNQVLPLTRKIYYD